MNNLCLADMSSLQKQFVVINVLLDVNQNGA